MAILKLTKNELRTQQNRLSLFQKYLPTLQLKKAMLQFEVDQANAEIVFLKEEFAKTRKRVDEFTSLLQDVSATRVLENAEIIHVQKHYENIAGVEIPVFDTISFRDSEYFLFDTPVWTDLAIVQMREAISAKEKVNIAIEKRRALEKELREVSIRVNLFEKILIPRSLQNIKKIRVFLSDQQLSSIAQAKVAKRKIQEAASL